MCRMKDALLSVSREKDSGRRENEKDVRDRAEDGDGSKSREEEKGGIGPAGTSEEVEESGGEGRQEEEKTVSQARVDDCL